MESTQSVLQNAELDTTARSYLAETAKWAKFLAIIGFVFIGLMVIIAFFAGSLMAFMPGGSGMPAGASVMLTLIYLVIAALYFFPCLYLYRFAVKARQAVATNTQDDFNESLRNLKACFRFVGIITLVIICIYAVFFLIAIVAGGFSAMNS